MNTEVFMKEYMLSTYDNPYDPFDQFDEWYEYDTSHGYNSCSLLDRVCVTSEDFNDQMQQDDIVKAIDNIIKIFGGNYKKVSRERKEEFIGEPSGD